MVDIKFIRDNAEAIKVAIKNKNLGLNLDELLEADKERVVLIQEIEKLQGEKNALNDEMQKAKDAESRKPIIERGKKIKEETEALEPKLKEANRKFEELMVKVPTVPSADTPVGKSEDENVEVYKWGEIKKFDFVPKSHIEIGKALDILDLERGAKVGGYRGYYLKNEGTLLVMGMMMYAIQKMVKHGYAPMIPPTLVKEAALFGSGYFKGLEYNQEVDEIYQVATSGKEATGEASKDKKFLVGTAEPSLLAYYSDETLKEDQLPMKICGYSQCYRSEIGSYGKDTKGMYRVHEFMKVEQIVLCKADAKEAEKLQNDMIAISREMHEELGLPYRQLQICTGDMGAGKYRQFDLEAWLPGMNRYGETGSASIFLDWQSRRLNVKYVDKNGDKKYVYMLNNTALPTPRIFIAILENYQTKEGTVMVPEVLQPYVGKKEIKPR